MILCPSCSQRNPEGAKRCQACGEPMAGFIYRVCPSCDAVNAAENAFCHRCLTPLDGSVELNAEPGDDVPVTPYAPHAELPKPAPRARPGRRGRSAGHAGRLARRRAGAFAGGLYQRAWDLDRAE